MSPDFRLTGAIFDMDGLMIDTERPALRAWKQACADMGCILTDEVEFRTIGVSEAACRDVYRAEFGPDFPYDEVRADVSRILEEGVRREGIPLRPGLLVLLDKFAELGVPLGVATSTRKERALLKLERTGLRGRFSAFAFGDEVVNGKPAPDIFLLAAEGLGIPPASCVGFEDSTAGLQSLHAAGIRSVFVKDCIEPPPEVLDTVWLRCADLAEAARVFKTPVFR